MLVLSRKRNDVIVLNPNTADKVRIVVVDVGGGKVRLGVEAPPEVIVVREEIIDRARPVAA